MMDKVIMRSDHERQLRYESLPPNNNFHNDVNMIIISPSLRTEVFKVLHSAHQRVTAMNERAKANVYWPEITNDIQRARKNCSSCDLIVSSNPR